MIEKSNWSQQFVSLKKVLFYILILGTILVNLVDLLYMNMLPYVRLLNMFNIVIGLVIFVFFLFKKINLLYASSLIIYVDLFNILSSILIEIEKAHFNELILRSTIFTLIIIPFAGFIISKIHCYIVGFLYFAFYIFLVILSKNEYLFDSLPSLFVAVVCFILASYYLLRLLENSYNKQHELITKLEKQNELVSSRSNELKSINIKLSEKQEIIEKQKQNLTELNQSKDTFFSIISHDLRAPFNAMLGFSDLMIDAFKKKEYDRAESYSRFIHKSSKNGYYLLENLLKWANTQTGRLSHKPFSFEITDLINETFNLLIESATKKELKIVKDIPKSLLVFADRNMIFTVLRNLISNAIKYTTEFGEIEISVIQKDNYCQVSISDNGIGISKENISKIFKIDEHYTTGGTNNETGTGLGLILCKDFVEKSKGEIWVESSLNKGSKFSFTIPLSTENE